MNKCHRMHEVVRWFDGQTNTGETALPRHLETCAACAAHLKTLQALRKGAREIVARNPLHEPAFEPFMAGLREQTTRPLPRRRTFWAVASLSAAALVVAASLFLVFSYPDAAMDATIVESYSSELEGATITSYASDSGVTTVKGRHLVSFAGLIILMGAVLAGRERPAPPPARVTITAICATHEARGHKEFEPGLDHVRRALLDLGQDTFRKVCVTTISAAFDDETELRINRRYTLSVKPLSKEPNGQLRMHFRVQLIPHDPQAKPITALATTVAMRPGKQFMLRGMKQDKGEKQKAYNEIREERPKNIKEEPKLAFDIIEKIRKMIPDIFLVSHGSSSVPAELVDVINKYGGNMKKTMGVPVASLQKAIKLGMNKINVDTDGRLAITGAIRKVFAETPDKFDPRDYLKPAREALAAIIAERMNGFGTAGHIKDVKMVTLAEMAKFYKKG